MNNTTLPFKTLLLSATFSLLSIIDCSAQMEVGSVWKATGNLESGLSSSGVDSTKMHFLGSGVFQLTYETSLGAQTETSTWADVSSSEFKFTYDPTGMVFGAICPDDSTFVVYSINGNQLTMDVVTGSCTTANGILASSVWNKVGGSSAGIIETENGIQTVYPNPSNGEINVTLTSGVNANDLRITTILGQEVPFTISPTGENNAVIRLINVEKGIYYLGIGSEQVETIVIQ